MPRRVILLVQDRQGYLNLSELLARAWTRSDGAQARGAARMAAGTQRRSADALGRPGRPGGAGADGRRRQKAADVALQLAGLFTHRFYMELQRAGRADDERHVVAAVHSWRRACTCRWWPPTRCSS
jgi:DNA polymerase III subunit alpha